MLATLKVEGQRVGLVWRDGEFGTRLVLNKWYGAGSAVGMVCNDESWWIREVYSVPLLSTSDLRTLSFILNTSTGPLRYLSKVWRE